MSLDQGTTSSRYILFDRGGNICASVQKEFRQIYPQPVWLSATPSSLPRRAPCWWLPSPLCTCWAPVTAITTPSWKRS